eukprot:scaffold3504_cov240-Pinguiococcus_pyrenoidosus.AAC.71
MKRKAVAGEFKSAREAKKKTTTAEDSLSTMDIEILCDAIPGFLRLLAKYFSHSEQIHVLSLVSKAWKTAMPLYLPVRRRREAVNEFLTAFLRNPNALGFWQRLPIENEFLHVLEECDVRMWDVEINEEGMEERRGHERRKAQARDTGKGSGRGFYKVKHHQTTVQMRVRVRPDASCVVSMDLDQKRMELKFQTTPGFYFRCQGTIVAWAKRRVGFKRTWFTFRKGLTSLHGDFDGNKGDDQEDETPFTCESLFDEEWALQTDIPRNVIAKELPNAPKEGEQWQDYAIVDVGVVRLSDYTDDIYWILEREMLVMPGRRAEELFHDLVRREAEEGVAYVDNTLSGNQRDNLLGAIDRLQTSQDRPGDQAHSSKVPRHLVDPSWYAYAARESQFFGSQDLSVASMAPRPVEGSLERLSLRPDENLDIWGRKYEEFKHQWLPTYFNVASDCKVQIEDYINGIPRAEHPELYAALETLFERFVPLLEHAWTYGLELRFQENYDHIGWQRPEIYRESGYLSTLRGSRLQVVTRIVDFELQPGQEHEGTWHVEGLPHENIVATAVYVAASDECIKGGKLCFQRAFDEEEGIAISNVSQEPFSYVTELVNRGLLPLGALECLENRMLVCATFVS